MRGMTITERGDAVLPQGIKSIEVGARVLLALEQGRGPMALSDVARASGLHPAKTHRYLVSLVRTGLASQSVATGLYDLGPASRHLGVEALRRTDVVSAASAHASALREQTGQTVNVAVWSDAGPALVRWDPGQHELPIAIRVGSTLPLLDSAVGQVFLAYLPASDTARVLKSQQRRGTTRVLPAKEVDAIRSETLANGMAQTRDQMIFGLSALAAPVFGPAGAIEVVLGLVMPSGMMRPSEAKRLSGLLRAAADRASDELGSRTG